MRILIAAVALDETRGLAHPVMPRTVSFGSCRDADAWIAALCSSRSEGMTTIGLIGSGNIGSTVARLAVDAGYHVVLSNSRGPETLSDVVERLGPRARAATAAEGAEGADIAVVTLPLKN